MFRERYTYSTIEERKMNAPYFCDCMKRTITKTSWTDLNPGRRFRACAGVGENGCGFFQWIDPPMCARSKEIMPGLLRRVNRAENRIIMLSKREKLLVLVLILLMVIIFFQFVGVLEVSVGDGSGGNLQLD